MKMEKLLELSRKVEVDDLDWELAAKVGLTQGEVVAITYFADIEGQTIYYLREMLNTVAAKDPDTVAFLTMWNYEEFFHSTALCKLLKVCGHELDASRKSEVRDTVQLADTIEDWARKVMSVTIPEALPALMMAWGASQELLTLKGYQELAKNTKNPVFAELCHRIAKQERRHFAWYYNSAKGRLAANRGARILTRLVFDNFWSPVGAGVKTDADVAELCNHVFPDGRFPAVAQEIDEKLGQLPGLTNFSVVFRYASKLESLRPQTSPEAADTAESSTTQSLQLHWWTQLSPKSLLKRHSSTM